MAETVKKTTAKPKAPAKPRKSAAAKDAASENGTHAGSNGKPAIVTQMKYSHEQVAQLAHRYWAERRQRHGHHEEDWFRAEQELRTRAS
jgi:hypothetical protein